MTAVRSALALKGLSGVRVFGNEFTGSPGEPGVFVHEAPDEGTRKARGSAIAVRQVIDGLNPGDDFWAALDAAGMIVKRKG